MPSCSCDYDAPEFYIKEICRARKPHRCSECPGTIVVGEKYEHVSGKWEGCIGTFNTCSRCVDLRTWVRNSVPCFCWAHGNMHDDAKETVEEAVYRAPVEAAGLRFGLSRRLISIRRFNAAARVSA
jgi:hypothetical protein